jgi:hypothetical protein
MLPRARRVLQIVEGELSRREQAIENDISLNRIDIGVIFGTRTGNPVKVKLVIDSETDLGAASTPLTRVGGR